MTLLVIHYSRVSCEIQLQDPIARCSLIAHTDQIFTLSHTQPLHNFHLNTEFLIAELQANLEWNKANTWLNKFNLTKVIIKKLFTV